MRNVEEGERESERSDRSTPEVCVCVYACIRSCTPYKQRKRERERASFIGNILIYVFRFPRVNVNLQLDALRLATLQLVRTTLVYQITRVNLNLKFITYTRGNDVCGGMVTKKANGGKVELIYYEMGRYRNFLQFSIAIHR